MTQNKMYLLMFLAMLSWGGTWINAKVLASYLDPYDLIFWRFLFSAVALIPMLFILKPKLRISLKQFSILLCSSIMLMLYNKYFFLGAKFGDAGFGGVLVTTLVPINTFLLLALFGAKKIKLTESIALCLGTIGAMTILNIWTYNLNSIWDQNIKYFLFASLLFPFVTLLNTLLKEVSSLVVSFYLFSLMTFFDYVFILNFEITSIMPFDAIFWLNLGLISVVGTSFGMYIYFLGAIQLGVKKSNGFFFFIPTSAMVFSAIFLGETFNTSVFIGGTLSILSIYLLNGYKLPFALKKISK